MNIMNNPYHSQKLFFRYHTQKAIKILQGKIPSPSLVEIDLTDGACNQGCIHCCSGSGTAGKLRSIDIDLLLPFLATTYEHGTYAYELVGGGEPTNHHQIEDIIEGIALLKKPDRIKPRIGLVTNGVCLERVFSVAKHLEWIRVSLDAPNKTVYNPLHGINESSNHFEKVIQNIKTLTTLVNPKKIRIAYLVVPPHNHQRKNIFETAVLAKKLGVKHIVYRPAFLNYSVSDDIWQEASEAVLKTMKMHENGFVVRGNWRMDLKEKAHPQGVCRTRPLVMVIKADGTLPTCFLYRKRLGERPAIGHISQGFENVWFSPTHQKSLQIVERQDCPTVCKLYRADEALTLLEETVNQKKSLPRIDELEIDNPYFI